MDCPGTYGVDVHAAFAVATVASVGMVTSYLAAALKGRLPWKVAAAGQIFYLVLFSYSFFLKGMSGLTGAIGSVVTLAVLMKLTAHIDWNEVFGARPVRSAAPPPAGGAPGAELPLTDRLESLEREMIEEALERSGGVKTRAAEILGIKTSALYYKLDKYGLDEG